MLARLVWGARLSVSIGAAAVALALIVGVPIGALSGYAGGAIDNVLMRCMDALLAFPALLLALGLVAIMGPGSTSTTLAIGIVYTPGVARLTRGVVLAERPQEYVQAAHALGQRDRWVLVRHIMPNCVSALLVQASVNFANAMVIEAGLSFLGIGTPPPTASWGLMLNEARAFMTSAKHVAIAPGVAISLAVLGWNLLGDGLRDALDPRLTDGMRRGPATSTLRQQVGDADQRSRRRQRRNGPLDAQRVGRAVPPAESSSGVGHRVAVDLEGAAHEVEDPVVGQAGPSVEAALVIPVQRQARHRHLDDEHEPGGVLATVVAGRAGGDCDIGFRLGLVVQRDGALGADLPARAERALKRLLDEANRRVVRTTLARRR